MLDSNAFIEFVNPAVGTASGVPPVSNQCPRSTGPMRSPRGDTSYPARSPQRISSRLPREVGMAMADADANGTARDTEGVEEIDDG